MNSDRWSLIRRLHAEALDLPQDARKAFLESQCAGDQVLLGEILELLAQDTEDQFLETEAVVQVASGLVLGDFELLEEIGSGGTGIVFRARQLSLDREVALKIMPRHFALNEVRVARFNREAKAAAKLKHPGIAPVYAVGCADNHHFFAMELVAGHNLSRELELQSEGRGLCTSAKLAPPFLEAARIIMQTADALAFAHSKGVVHRDIKPENILLDSECRPRLVDFGLAKDDSLGSITVQEKVEGTPYYMSPEQAHLIEDRVDARTDIYSLGVVLYELLTRSRPFEGKTAQEVISKIIRRDPKPVRSVAPEVPRDLAVICSKAMEKQPGDRYSTVQALHDDLKNFLDGKPILARPPGLIRKGLRRVQRHRVAASFVAATFLALASAGWAREVMARQSWPQVSIRVASGPEVQVLAIPIQHFTGLPRGDSIDLGFTPVNRASLEPGQWRFLLRRDAQRFVELDHLLSQASAGEDATLLDLVGRIPSGDKLPFETHAFESTQFSMKMLTAASGEQPDSTWRSLELPGFELGLREISFGMYRAYLRESGRLAPKIWSSIPVDEAPNELPVVLISRSEAQAFAEWYGYRLPYASEWEYAAMGSKGRRFPWGDAQQDNDQRANIHVSGPMAIGSLEKWRQFLAHADPVDSLPEGRTPEGLYHMLGNVSEFTASLTRFQVPLNPSLSPDARLALGGYWRAASFERYLPGFALTPISLPLRQVRTGFRVARSLPSRGGLAPVTFPVKR